MVRAGEPVKSSAGLYSIVLQWVPRALISRIDVSSSEDRFRQSFCTGIFESRSSAVSRAGIASPLKL